MLSFDPTFNSFSSESHSILNSLLTKQTPIGVDPDPYLNPTHCIAQQTSKAEGLTMWIRAEPCAPSRAETTIYIEVDCLRLLLQGEP